MLLSFHAELLPPQELTPRRRGFLLLDWRLYDYVILNIPCPLTAAYSLWTCGYGALTNYINFSINTDSESFCYRTSNIYTLSVIIFSGLKSIYPWAVSFRFRQSCVFCKPIQQRRKASPGGVVIYSSIIVKIILSYPSILSIDPYLSIYQIYQVLFICLISWINI